MANTCYIPEQFEKEIVIHAVRVCTGVQGAPLILGIDGLPGEGKTFQCRTVLERIGFQVFSMSADMFESDQAGEPAKRLRGIYEEAYRYTETKNRYSAIVIDDADVAFGSWGDLYQYTVNTQLITGELMSLADASGVRIPIFMTGNDLSKLYGPLK